MAQWVKPLPAAPVSHVKSWFVSPLCCCWLGSLLKAWWKQWKMTQMFGAPAIYMVDLDEAPDFRLAQPWPSQSSEEWTRRWKFLSFSLCLSLANKQSKSERERERAFICCLTPQMTTMSRTEPKPRARPPGMSLNGYHSPKHTGHHLLASLEHPQRAGSEAGAEAEHLDLNWDCQHCKRDC